MRASGSPTAITGTSGAGSAGAGVAAVAKRSAVEGAAGAATFFDLRYLGRVRNRLPFLDQDLAQDSFERGRDLGVDLVGDDLEERLVLGHAVAGLLEPLAYRPLGYALAELRHCHLGHETWSSTELRHIAPAKPGRAAGRTTR
jgi:hypothetical protein